MQRRLARLKDFEPPHEHVEQPLACGFLGHVEVACRKHFAIDRLHMRGKDREL